MDLIIHDSLKLCEIQEEFCKHFPCLKLEFFSFVPGESKIFSEEFLIRDTNKTLGDVRHVHNFGHLSINGHQKVSTLEQNFIRIFGIDVQVFRKSGSVWLETTHTNSRSLTEQNKQGAEMENTVEPAADDHLQYYEQNH
jgi:hypothetical protein